MKITLKNIRENKDSIVELLKLKFFDIAIIDKILDLDAQWRSYVSEVEKLKEKRNKSSKKISDLKRNGEQADDIIKEMQSVSDDIKTIDARALTTKKQIDILLLDIPNTPHISVPKGENENYNIIIREWGCKPEFAFGIKDHVQLGESLNIFNFKAGAKISGSGFPVYTNMGARLERTLINFMIDHHTKKGYVEMFPPFLVNSKSMQTTGQLPKFIDDMYNVPTDELFCIPTAEVPVTNYYRDQELKENDFPIKFAAYSACFRREAGSYGKDTKGLLRLHQFNKVELVKFCTPDSSYDELEQLVNDAEEILQLLGLHYRIIELCTGDLSFSAAKCYDIEVWSPSEDKYLEVSSCSNFEAFQANRGNMKFRSSISNKLEYLHTLNGSGLATPRLMVALLETYQQKNGTIILPKALQTYMGTDTIKND